jgi:hypothetical protein
LNYLSSSWSKYTYFKYIEYYKYTYVEEARARRINSFLQRGNRQFSLDIPAGRDESREQN